MTSNVARKIVLTVNVVMWAIIAIAPGEIKSGWMVLLRVFINLVVLAYVLRAIWKAA